MPQLHKKDFEKAVKMIQEAFKAGAPGSEIKKLANGGSHIQQLRVAVRAGVFNKEHREWAVTYFGGEFGSKALQDKTKLFHKMTALFNNACNKGMWGTWL